MDVLCLHLPFSGSVETTTIPGALDIDIIDYIIRSVMDLYRLCFWNLLDSPNNGFFSDLAHPRGARGLFF